MTEVITEEFKAALVVAEDLRPELEVALEQVGATRDTLAKLRIVVIGPKGTREITRRQNGGG